MVNIYTFRPVRTFDIFYVYAYGVRYRQIGYTDVYSIKKKNVRYFCRFNTIAWLLTHYSPDLYVFTYRFWVYTVSWDVKKNIYNSFNSVDRKTFYLFAYFWAFRGLRNILRMFCELWEKKTISFSFFFFFLLRYPKTILFESFESNVFFNFFFLRRSVWVLSSGHSHTRGYRR